MRTQPELSVEMWECGDTECDCVKPVVLVRYPFDKPKPGVGICETIAEGPFETYGYGHDDAKSACAAQEKWLEEAREWYCQPTEIEAKKNTEGA